MKPTIQLINALRNVADALRRNPSRYEWASCDQCNCGLLVQTLLPIKRFDICFGEYWSKAAAEGAKSSLCGMTGVPVRQIFEQLAMCGLMKRDFVEIEFLRNREVVRRLGWKWEVLCMGASRGRTRWHWQVEQQEHQNAKDVARYFEVQADILEEQLAENFETRPLTLTPAKEQVSA